MTEEERRAALVQAVRRGSRPGALARACLLVARGEYPRLDPTVSLAEIDAFVERTRLALASSPTKKTWDVLAHVLGRVEAFRGPLEDYDDPENSYLNRVLARRRGLPILLSVLWIEVARGLGLPARGIPFPGHFAVFLGTGARGVYVDPFHGGRRLTQSEVLRLSMGPSGTAAVSRQWLHSCTPRKILLRVLANLSGSYERRGDGRRLDRVLTDQIALAPEDPMLLARRGEARARFGDRTGALRDLNVALAALPGGAAFERVHEQARVLARLGASSN